MNFSRILPAPNSEELLRAYTEKNGGIPVLPPGDTMPKAIERGDVGAVKAMLAKSKKYVKRKAPDWSMFDFLLSRKEVPIDEGLIIGNLETKYPQYLDMAIAKIKASGRPYDALTSSKVKKAVAKNGGTKGAAIYKKHFP